MTWLLAITTMSAFAQQATVTGPDSFLKVNVSVKQGIPIYSVTYKDKTILEDSPLGFVANVGDFSRDMTFTGQKENKIDKTYTQDRIKQSQIHYQANELTCTFTNKEKKKYKYNIPRKQQRYCFPLRNAQIWRYGKHRDRKRKLPVLTSPPSPLLSCARKATP